MRVNNHRNPLEAVVAVIILLLLIYFNVRWNWLIIAVIGIGVLSITFKDIAKGIDFFWYRIVWLLGKIIPNIVLTILFYLLLTPLALLSRIFSKNNPLKLKNQYDSLFVRNNEQIDKSYFEKLW
ncbi:hypothetical protein [Mesoflavibacter zeaxanthinifaciens]|uniref:hypothetical protein n=1 Tax=Mesoflavibacter zeaxanthinifaciens TaxID=393060 RepID=UPI003A8CDF0E